MRMLALVLAPLVVLACDREPAAPTLPHLSAARSADVQDFTDAVSGFFVGSCQGFDVLSDWTADWHIVMQYDEEGTPHRQVSVYRLLGQSRYYNSTRPDLAVYGGPAEIQNAIWEYDRGVILLAGPTWRIVLPGSGPIFVDIGEVTIDLAAFLSGQIVVTHSGGHHQWFENDFGALCTALTP
jgi:hypothetical protein